MSIQNEMPGYNEMNQYLNQQGTGLTPAEMHGLISGMICGGNDDSSWLPLLHDLTNEGMAFGHELAQALRKMHSATSDALQDDGFLFQLYLPDGDDVSVFDREATIGVTDSLVHLFANRWAPLVVGRNIGLMAMELFTPARDVLVQRTLGWVAR